MFGQGYLMGFVVCVPPLILQQLGHTASEIAFLLTLLSALQVVAHLYILPRLARHVGREQSLVGLAAMTAAAAGVLAFWQRDARALFGVLPLVYLGACLSAGLSNMTSAIYAQHFAFGVVGTIAGISRAFFSLGNGQL
jgi:Na+/melibiose symporter-like transporter